MADMFRSAFSYFSSATVTGGSTRGNDFVGQTVQLGDGLTFSVKKVLAEGMLICCFRPYTLFAVMG